MARGSPSALSGFLSSPYAIELQRGLGERYSDAKLEAEYAQARLTEARGLVRIACLLTVLVTVVRGIEQSLTGSWNAALAIHVAIAFGISAVLAGLAWSPLFGRFYLPAARIGVPVRNAIAAIPIAGAAAHGHVELLVVLPLLALGPFFFTALPFRAALVSVLLSTVAYVASAAAYGMEVPLAIRTSAFLIVVTAACAYAAWQLEKQARRSFLEGRLVAELALLDPLTGMKNRRVLDEHLVRVWEQASDDRRTIAVLMIDIDQFKAYNDKYGHQAGDQTLHRVASTLQSIVRRPFDVLARYGGEEFAAILYDVDVEEARETAERMRREISDLGIEHRGSRICAKVTISVGVAAIAPSRRRHSRGALQLADQALYRAKSEGRNRVVLMDETEYSVLVTGVFPQSAFARKA